MDFIQGKTSNFSIKKQVKTCIHCLVCFQEKFNRFLPFGCNYFVFILGFVSAQEKTCIRFLPFPLQFSVSFPCAILNSESSIFISQGRTMPLLQPTTMYPFTEIHGEEPLFMLPGWTCSTKFWKYNVEELSRHFQVVLMDMRGHGESEKVLHSHRISRYAMWT